MAKKNSRKVEENKKTNHAKKEELRFSGLIDHAKEPLLLLSILTFLLSIAFPFTVPNAVPLIIFPIVLALAAVGAIVFIYKYAADGKDITKLVALPVIMLLTASFLYWAQDYQTHNSNDLVRDYSTFAMFFGMLTLGCALWVHKFMRLPSAIVVALFFSSLIIHLTPAYSPYYATYRGNYISDLDSYFVYRPGLTAVATGHLPDRETLAYPALPVTFDSNGNLISVATYSTNFPMAAGTLYASTAVLFAQFGFSVQDVAILLPGILGAISVVLFYLLLKEAFKDLSPYNQPAALLGAFMLMVNASFASRAIATNPEDDTLGMLLFISTLFLFMLAMNRKSLLIGFLSGLSALFLGAAWGGISYLPVVMGIFGGMYAIINFVNRKNPVDFVPYFFIVMIMSQLAPIFMHDHGAMPRFILPGIPFLLPLAGPIVIAFLLETVNRLYLERGKIHPEGKTVEDRLNAAMRKYAPAITVVLLLVVAYYSIFVTSPMRSFAYIGDLINGARQSEILGMTTAEQREMCSDGFTAGCLFNTLRNHFGLGVVFGVLMVVFFGVIYALLFASKIFGFKFDSPLIKSPGVLLTLALSLPMLYGIVLRSQYQFVASVPLVALGATIGLLFPMKKEDFEGWNVLRVFPLLLVVLLPLALVLSPSLAEYEKIPIVGPFGGSYPMYMEAGERIVWDGALQYIAKLPSDSIIMTWWDYGHWITTEAHRISIVDNTKNQRFMVQDVARFHVIADTEDEALDIARKYHATQVVIDYTMIAKSGAPHFIATSGLGGWIPLKGIGANITCVKGTGCDEITNTNNAGYASVPLNAGSISIDLTTSYVINQSQIELSSDGTFGYKVEASLDGANWTTMVDKTHDQFNGLQTDSFNDVRARYLRITGTSASAGDALRVKSIAFYNPRFEGSYTGYAGCQFVPGNSQVKPVPDVTKGTSEVSMVSKLFFDCTPYMGVVFNIRDQSYSVDDVYVALISNGQVAQLIPWKAWRDRTGASILGIQSFRSVIGNALGYPDKYASVPTYTTLVYVPGPKESPYDMNKVMMTKLYLGDYLDEYQQLGLADAGIEKPKYFSLVEDFRGDKPDSSYWGYVRVYNINYPEKMNASSNSSAPAASPAAA